MNSCHDDLVIFQKCLNSKAVIDSDCDKSGHLASRNKALWKRIDVGGQVS